VVVVSFGTKFWAMLGMVVVSRSRKFPLAPAVKLAVMTWGPTVSLAADVAHAALATPDAPLTTTAVQMAEPPS